MAHDTGGMPNHEQVLHRLEILRGKLESEGMYVSANTVALAEELIQHQARLLADSEARDDGLRKHHTG
jgi:hypothetical protein